MQIKQTVIFQGISNELILGIIVINSVFSKHNVELVLTSVVDSVHSKNSLHYSGNAVDIRTSNIPDSVVTNIFSELIASLGPHFEVIMESDHIHVEYQPNYQKN